MALTYNDVKNEIASAVNSDYKATVYWTRLHEKGAGYNEAHQYAIRVGQVTGKVLKKYQPEDISDWDIEDLIPGVLGLNHKMVAEACREAQKNLNRRAGVGMEPQTPKFDGNRAYGMAEHLKDRGEVGPEFYDQVENFDQNVVDESIRENAEEQSEAGLHAKIVRTAESGCCKWCDDLAGTYDYEEVRDTGNPIWARHDNCRCLIEYIAEKRERVNNYRRR